MEDSLTRFQRDPQLQRFERALNLLLDRDRLLPAPVILPVLEFAQAHELPLVEAQAQRAVGRVERDPERLSRSIALFERARATPYAARVRCELALISGDDAELKAGLQVLEQLGDAEQVGRFERLQVR